MVNLAQKYLSSTFSAILLLYALLALVFINSNLLLINFWLNSPEYGHGMLLAGISFYLLWLRRHQISSIPVSISPIGIAVVIAALVTYAVTILGDIQVVMYYSFIIALSGIPMALGGRALFRPFKFPLLLLVLSIPFHPSINAFLTTKLQLISSDIGVWLIRAMGMAALQDGNVIDMGNFVMLVEEACSGLRYLLPLASLSLMAAYYYKGNIFTKCMIFLSVIPITVFMNSLRIAVTGLIIKYYGSEAAEGFLHDFEGFVVFLAACLLLMGVLAAISIFTKKSLSIEKNFFLPSTENQPKPLVFTRFIPLGSLSLLILISGAAIISLISYKTEVIPKRESFSQFPLVIDNRELYPDTLSDKFLDILNPDDYFIGDFFKSSTPPINLYMAYYQSQQQGSLIHSPKDCLPAGGWDILSTEIIDLDGFGFKGKANKAIIKKGDDNLLVYYWINQQGLNFAKESSASLSLIKRSILFSRTDATLVRVIAPFATGEQEIAENHLRDFILSLQNILPRFLPI